MTSLKKTIYRKVALGDHPRDILVVGMDPRGMYLFRELGCRKMYQFPIARVYRFALEVARSERKKERAATRALKKGR